MSEAHWKVGHEKIPLDKPPSPYIEQLEPLFPRNALVADLGGGTGADAVYLLEQGHSVIEVDLSTYALERATDRAVTRGFHLDTRKAVIGDEALPLDDESIDIAYSRLALHYFNRETTVAIFREIYTKLKKGGYAYLTLKSPDDENEMAFLRSTANEIEPGVFMDGEQLKSRFTTEELKQILMEAGIEDSEVNVYIENLEGRNEVIKSGNEKFILNEVRFTKK